MEASENEWEERTDEENENIQQGESVEGRGDEKEMKI